MGVSWSPTLLIKAKATSSNVFIARIFSSTDCKGSNGTFWSALSTRAKSQEGMEGRRGGFNLPTPLRNLTTISCFPTTLAPMGRNKQKLQQHILCGWREPSLQPMLQEGTHGSDRAPSGLVDGAHAEVMVSATSWGSARYKHCQPLLRWAGCPWTWGDAGRNEWHSLMVWRSQRNGLGSASQALRDRESRTKGTTDIPAVGQRGGLQGRGCVRKLGCDLEPPTAACWQ